MRPIPPSIGPAGCASLQPFVLPNPLLAEVIELIRKFCLCGLLRFIQPESATQVIVGIMFCVIYLSLVAYLTPYDDYTDNLFSTARPPALHALPSHAPSASSHSGLGMPATAILSLAVPLVGTPVAIYTTPL